MKRREKYADVTDPSTISTIQKIANVSIREAKTFWQNRRKEGNVDIVFKEVLSKLQLLCQKIKDGSATDQDHMRGLMLVNLSDLEDFETCQRDESFVEDQDAAPIKPEELLPIATSADMSKCACLQLTAKELDKDAKGTKRGNIPGYKHKRLPKSVPTGIYECNVSCKCDHKMCQNRVVQHGLQVRLQVFKTKGKGWGVRCLDDLDRGTFVCIYAGRILMKSMDVTVSVGSVEAAPAKMTPSICPTKIRYSSHSDSEIAASPSTISNITPLLRGSSRSDLKRKRLCKMKEGRLDSVCVKRPKTKTAILQKRKRQLIEEGTVTMMHSSDDELFTPPASPKVLLCGNTEDEAESIELIHTSVKKTLQDNEAGYVSDESSYSVTCSSKENSDPPDSSQAEHIYFLDSSTEGNIGRFLNHSCSPNLFVQHVFVETHSKKFPWVAFFTKSFIKAGTELTWEYNYDIGSIPEKEIPCLCGHKTCRNVIV
ncbi:histone-lysine N-methyltransferase SETDB2 isoform X4 [Engystomops pustulosus]|uniref:histone-lysine N-methyltransferase SETDB2 isoform X4 n=1 Tax=Engystomops pustulosus TaxID=76066 RepID=UPI003AFA9B8B